MVIGVLLILAAIEVGSSAVSSLVSGVHAAEVTPVSFVVMGGTLAINVLVTRYERREGKRLNSDVLMADASHTLSDAMGVDQAIVGLALVGGLPIADSVMALVVMVAILYTAVDVFRAAFETLSDKAHPRGGNPRGRRGGSWRGQRASHPHPRHARRCLRRPARAGRSPHDRRGFP